jgi:hypothetical protein
MEHLNYSTAHTVLFVISGEEITFACHCGSMLFTSALIGGKNIGGETWNLSTS